VNRRASAWIGALCASIACGEPLAPARDDGGATASEGGATDAAAADASACSGSKFSDDFDDTALELGWSQSSVTAGGGMTAFENAFQAQTPSGARLSPRTAALEKRFDTAPTSLRCTFKLRLDTGPNDDFVDAFGVELTAPDGRLSRVRVSVQHSTLGLREDVKDAAGNCTACPTKTPSLTLPVTVQTGAWNTITFVTDFKTASASLVGGPTITDLFVGFVPTKMTIILGVVNFASEPAMHTYDDLVCELGC
jgi:hypothetical protein